MRVFDAMIMHVLMVIAMCVRIVVIMMMVMASRSGMVFDIVMVVAMNVRGVLHLARDLAGEQYVCCDYSK
jgi:hypothetical protein